MQSKVLKLTIIFVIIMVFLTVFSRIADDMVIARVQTIKYTGSTIDYSIQENGLVTCKEQQAVNVEANQLVNKIYVSVGEIVEKGTHLVQLDMEHLLVQIDELQGEIDKLNLAIEDEEETYANSKTEQEKKVSRAQEDYNLAVISGDAEVSKALEAYNGALESYHQALSDQTKDQETDMQIIEGQEMLKESNVSENTDQAILAELEASLNEKKQLYDNTVIQRENAIREAGRILEDARFIPKKSSSIASTTIDKEQKQAQLDKLTAIKDAEGWITAPGDGVVQTIKVEIGELTSGGAMLIMGELSSEYQLCVTLEQSQKGNINVLDVVTVSGKNADGSIERIEDLTITSIRTNVEDSQYIDVMIDLGKADLLYGSEATMLLTKASPYYTMCVPVTALRKDPDNRYYVLTIEEQETILGTENVAAKQTVEVLESNINLAAIQCETLTSSNEIIVESSKTIEDGSRVKVEKNNAQ